MEAIKCIFCDQDSDHIVVRENGYCGKKCLECGLIYISPRPSIGEIKDLYGHDQANISAQAHIQDGYAKRLYAKRNLQIIRRFVRRGSILEIGAGAGYFLDEARRAGFDVDGIELNSTQAEFIRRQMHIRCEGKPLDSQSFGSHTFDVVYHCDVISHFFDPIGEFHNINRKLHDGGLVVFETGNGGDIDAKYFKLIKTFQYPDHLFFFSEKNIRSLLESTGFELLESYRYSLVPQIRLISLVAMMMGKKPRTGDRQPTLASASVPQTTKRVGGTLAKNIYAWLAYLLRYKVGYLAPKSGRPQTIVFVARKK